MKEETVILEGEKCLPKDYIITPSGSVLTMEEYAELIKALIDE